MCLGRRRDCLGGGGTGRVSLEISSLLVSCTRYSNGCLAPLLRCWIRVGSKTVWDLCATLDQIFSGFDYIEPSAVEFRYLKTGEIS